MVCGVGRFPCRSTPLFAQFAALPIRPISQTKPTVSYLCSRIKQDKEMNSVMTDIWPLLLTVVLSNITAYIGFINKMRSQISVLEDKVKRLETMEQSLSDKIDEINKMISVLQEKMKRVEQRQDSHSKKNDEIIKLLNDLKLEVVEKLGALATNMGKLSSDVDNINRSFTVYDEGINKTKKKK